MTNHPNRPKRRRSSPYEVLSCWPVGKKWTATNNARSEHASRRDYRVFDSREEAQAWADQKNAERLAG